MAVKVFPDVVSFDDSFLDRLQNGEMYVRLLRFMKTDNLSLTLLRAMILRYPSVLKDLPLRFFAHHFSSLTKEEKRIIFDTMSTSRLTVADTKAIFNLTRLHYSSSVREEEFDPDIETYVVGLFLRLSGQEQSLWPKDGEITPFIKTRRRRTSLTLRIRSTIFNRDQIRDDVRAVRCDEKGEATCPVCFEDRQSAALKLCEHQFCMDCIMEIISENPDATCPLCRTEIMEKVRPFAH
jgi:hypothetical protein